MRAIRRIGREHGRWLGVSFLLAIGLAVVAGSFWMLVLVYAAVNGAGTVLYVDGLDPRQASGRRRRRVMLTLAAVLVPVGVFGVLASKEGVAPIDAALGDEGIRSEVPRSALYGRREGSAM